MRYLIFFLLLVCVDCFAQETGIQFDHSLSWEEIKAKSKAENKFIFMDIFTTWCGPCRRMADSVFPRPEVGAFFNDKFISIKVQMDETPKDNEYVKRWHDDAAIISKQYGIMAYPTFLFFSPGGELVHRFTSTKNAQEFIAASSKALNPETQYMSKMNNSDHLPAEQLKELAETALNNYDLANARYYFMQYLGLQQGNYSEDMVKFLDRLLRGSDDSVFSFYSKESEHVDKVMGRGYTGSKVESIILAEELYKDMNGEEINFVAVEKRLKQKYPLLAEKLLMKAKLGNMLQKNQRKEYLDAVVPFMKKFGHSISPIEASWNAYYVIRMTKDATLMKTALKWSEQALKEARLDRVLINHARILYSFNRNAEAVALQEEGMAKMDVKDVEIKYIIDFEEEILDKMKKGETIN